MPAPSQLRRLRAVVFSLSAAVFVLVASVTAPSPSFAQDEVIFSGAGDVATCANTGDEMTASLLDNIPGLVFVLGDAVQGDGGEREFTDCYTPSWGHLLDRTRPVPGNHDYNTPGAAAYFAYFGDSAGAAGQGYYSFNYGAWHVVALNSNVDIGPGSDQAAWLEADLAANPSGCTLLMAHHPRFSSGAAGVTGRLNHAFQIAYDAGADIVLGGDAHHYERFAPMNPRGQIEPERGIRQFVVGTGGAALTGLGERWKATEFRQANNWGVLKLTLRPGSYAWEFIPVVADGWSDSGEASCVNP